MRERPARQPFPEHLPRLSQAPAPFHATPGGWAGPCLLAMILLEKFGSARCQAEQYTREGVPLSLSTLAD